MLEDLAPTDGQIRALWLGHGGSFHGPKIEHGTMKESNLLPLLRKLMVVARAADKLDLAVNGIALHGICHEFEMRVIAKSNATDHGPGQPIHNKNQPS